MRQLMSWTVHCIVVSVIELDTMLQHSFTRRLGSMHDNASKQCHVWLALGTVQPLLSA